MNDTKLVIFLIYISDRMTTDFKFCLDKYHYKPLADPRGGVPGTRTPFGPISFIFIQFSEEILPNNIKCQMCQKRLAPPPPPPLDLTSIPLSPSQRSGKFWIPHCLKLLKICICNDKNIQNLPQDESSVLKSCKENLRKKEINIFDIFAN